MHADADELYKHRLIQFCRFHPVPDQVGSAARWHARRAGQFWISWPAFVEAIMLLGVEHTSFGALRAEADVCRSAGWYWPNRDFIIVCERPRAIRRDDAGRLHCESGPAVDYGETFRLYSWHGTTVPSECSARSIAPDALHV